MLVSPLSFLLLLAAPLALANPLPNADAAANADAEADPFFWPVKPTPVCGTVTSTCTQ